MKIKNKKQWKEMLKDFPELTFHEWLEYLPVYNSSGNAIKCCNPIVVFKPTDNVKLTRKLATIKHKFINSTVNYIPGYHYPENCTIRAIGYIVN